MVIPGECSGDVRSTKRQRFPSLHEEEEDEEDDEDYEPASTTEDEEEAEDEEEEEEVTLQTMETLIGTTAFEDLTREEDHSESPNSSQSVKLHNAEFLDCPTCYEPLKRPIYQCKNGHIACSSCCKKLKKKCSFCRSHIGDIRCRVMEKVIEASIVPCLNEKYGCTKTTTYYDQSVHAKICLFVRCFCPVPNCSYVGSYTDLKSHACSAHTWDEAVLFKFGRSMIFGMDLGKRKMVVLREEKEGDLIVVQAFKGTLQGGAFVSVNRIVPMSIRIPDFSCTLAKLDAYSTVRVGSIVKRIQKVSEELHLEDDVLWIPPKMLSNGHWKMEIGIGPTYRYVHV